MIAQSWGKGKRFLFIWMRRCGIFAQCWHPSHGRSWGRHKGTVGRDGGVQGQEGSPPLLPSWFPLFFIVSTVQTQLDFPADIFPSSGGVHSAAVLLPRHPCVFSLFTGGPSGKERAFGSEVQTFQEKWRIFPYFCHRLAVHFPYDCRPFSIIVLLLDSAVLGASARKSQWFQENSGSFPYVFHAFSVHLPYFFRMLLDRVEGPIFREAPSSLPASPVPSRFSPMTGEKSGWCLGATAGASEIRRFPAKDTPYGEKIEGEDGWGLLSTPYPRPYSRRISMFHRNMLLFTDLARWNFVWRRIVSRFPLPPRIPSVCA